jgi:hypothetical protein
MVAAVPAYVAHVEPVTAAQLGKSWHSGCPVPPSQLARIRLRFVGFDGAAHMGAIVVNRRVEAQVIGVFRELYAARFPVRRMIPVAAYGGSDDRAAAADDTSGFNCRKAVTAGPASWSMHAYGEAIDVNDVENPYIEGRTVLPPAGRAYVDRSRVRPGMAVLGGALVRAFTRVGWGWGASFADYQHFSTNGR